MKINRFAIQIIIGIMSILGILIMSENLSAAVLIYGHISYEESNPKIIRSDRSQLDAEVSTPVTSGDIIVTSSRARCELKFNNGTVVRLDHNSRVKVVSVSEESQASKWRLTSLELQRGSLYTLNKSYNRERFQVTTPNATVNLKRNAISIISITEKGETKVFSEKGRISLLYSTGRNTTRTRSVKAGQGYIITTDHKLLVHQQQDMDFLAWNQYIEKNYKKLHYDISKVSQKIYSYSRHSDQVKGKQSRCLF